MCYEENIELDLLLMENLIYNIEKWENLQLVSR